MRTYGSFNELVAGQNQGPQVSDMSVFNVSSDVARQHLNKAIGVLQDLQGLLYVPDEEAGKRFMGPTPEKVPEKNIYLNEWIMEMVDKISDFSDNIESFTE